MSSRAESENLCLYFKIIKDNVSCLNVTFEFSYMKFLFSSWLLKSFPKELFKEFRPSLDSFRLSLEI
jgi:hypothetical protein